MIGSVTTQQAQYPPEYYFRRNALKRVSLRLSQAEKSMKRASYFVFTHESRESLKIVSI